MREYKLSPVYFSRLRRRTWIIVVPFVVLLFGMIFWVEFRFLAESFGDPGILYLVLPIAIIAVAVGAIIGVNLRQRAWKSFRIVLGDSSITRSRDGMLPVSISFTEITRLSEAPGKGMTVLASGPPRWIGIPSTIENYDDVRAALATAHSVESVSNVRSRGLQLLNVGVLFATLGSMLAAVFARNRVVSIIASSALIAILLWSIIAIRRSPYASVQQKRGTWSTAALVLIVVCWLLFKVFWP